MIRMHELEITELSKQGVQCPYNKKHLVESYPSSISLPLFLWVEIIICKTIINRQINATFFAYNEIFYFIDLRQIFSLFIKGELCIFH